jgi:hypothetical protein
MKNSIAVGSMLVSILLALSLGVVLAEVSKDMVNTTSPMNITNTTKNVTNITYFNVTNDTMPLNATDDVTNPFANVRGNIIDNLMDKPKNISSNGDISQLPLTN